MQEIKCPTCGDKILSSSEVCAECGEAALSADVPLRPGSGLSQHAVPASTSSSTPPFEAADTVFLRDMTEHASTVKLFRAEFTWNDLLDDDFRLPPSGDLAEERERNATWQKVVEPKTPQALAVVARRRPVTRKSRGLSRRQGFFPPRLVFWFSLIVLISVVLGGGFGIVLSFGREVPPVKVVLKHPATLLVSPGTITLGGILTLRGTNFTPDSSIILTRDGQIPLFDTGGLSAIQTDVRGSFSDTVIVDPAWLGGIHQFFATDAHTHKASISKIVVTGQTALQGPPHLYLSASKLDLGSGDSATNSHKLLALSNAGGGSLSWQASVNQPWLQISPQSGSIPSGSHLSVIVAGNRLSLSPEDYTARIVITSSDEQITLTVDMAVTPLQPAHEAVLQLSQSALTFTGMAQASDPSAQTVTLNNPGIQKLDWGAQVSMRNGAGWLGISPTSGEVAPASQQDVVISVSTQGLAPGVYKGTILFANQGALAIQGDLQSVFVSLTVEPLCTLTVSSNSLSFTSTSAQNTSKSQTLDIGVAHGCSESQKWSASLKGGSWLHINHLSGSTPTHPVISVAPEGLTPGTYHGSITLTSSTNSQIIPVTLTISPIPCSITGPAALTLQGTAGQTAALTQPAQLSTTGSCPHALTWRSSSAVAAPAATKWLSLATSGTMTSAGTSVPVSVNLTGLSADTYTGAVTITAVDSVTNQSVGSVTLAVTLTVLPACTLQAPSSTALNFSAYVGADPTPATASFVVSVTGTCASYLSIASSTDASSQVWLAASPSALSSGMETLTVTISSAALAAGTYTGTITLSASGGSADGSPQKVTVTLTVVTATPTAEAS